MMMVLCDRWINEAKGLRCDRDAGHEGPCNCYPEWICSDCGRKHGKMAKVHYATFHNGNCGWCGDAKAVTEPRDYGYPKFEGMTM